MNIILSGLERKWSYERVSNFQHFSKSLSLAMRSWNKGHKQIIRMESTKTGHMFTVCKCDITTNRIAERRAVVPLYLEYVINFDKSAKIKELTDLVNHMKSFDLDCHWPQKNKNNAIILRIPNLNNHVNDARKHYDIAEIDIKTVW